MSYAIAVYLGLLLCPWHDVHALAPNPASTSSSSSSSSSHALLLSSWVGEAAAAVERGEVYVKPDFLSPAEVKRLRCDAQGLLAAGRFRDSG